MTSFFVNGAIPFSAVLFFSSCTNRTEFLIREMKETTNYDSLDFEISVFFDGCLLKGDSCCSGDLAIAFSSETLNYEKIIIDTASVFIADTSHSFIEGSPLSIDLELRDKRKYKHHHLGEISLFRSDSANFKLRGQVTRSGAASQVIRADIEYRIKRESGPVWFE